MKNTEVTVWVECIVLRSWWDHGKAAKGLRLIAVRPGMLWSAFGFSLLTQILEPNEERFNKAPLTIWIGQHSKEKYKDIRERYKRAPIVPDLTRIIEDRIAEWHQKVLESEN
jgi:hypothetical protein